jgi:lysophospholipase L1-like esterase
MPDDRAGFLYADLSQLSTTLHQYDIQLVLVTHANRFSNDTDQVDRNYYLTAWRKVYPLYSEQALLEMEARLNDTVRLFAARNNIPLVDAAIAIPGGGNFFTDQVHFTETGAALLASLLAREIKPLLPQAAVSAL